MPSDDIVQYLVEHSAAEEPWATVTERPEAKSRLRTPESKKVDQYF